MNSPARILLVDDSVVVRGLLARIIDAEHDLEVAATAADGAIGVRKMASIQPDLVVLDIEMPNMDGLEALIEIRRGGNNVPVIMFSTLTDRGAASTLQALSLGATDYATKPQGSKNLADSVERVRDELVTKIRALVDRPPRTSPAANTPATNPPRKAGSRAGLNPPADAVVLGCSTGGPAALENVLTSWPEPLPVPMFVVQHMPPEFTRSLAKRLDRRSAAAVVEAEDGMTAEPGTCYIAPGSHHLALARIDTRSVALRLNEDPPENSCRPSVDPLFRSAAEAYRERLVAVMLTGMGSDGLAGTGAISELGCTVIAQNEASSVVWGMPGAITEAGLTSELLSIEDIGPRVAQLAARKVAVR